MKDVKEIQVLIDLFKGYLAFEEECESYIPVEMREYKELLWEVFLSQNEEDED